MRDSRPIQESIQVPVGAITLSGDLNLVVEGGGLVLFAHGSGSSRLSPRNRFVADKLNQAGLNTLLIDLLTADEAVADDRSRQFRFDIGLLSKRLTGVVDWLESNGRTRDLPLGCFGASTGAAAALMAAAERPDRVAAVVSRGGRPDLAGETLRDVQAATLLIVGSRDQPVIEVNREAFDLLSRVEDKRLVIVPGATHLFEEPGTLEQVADLAADWFSERLIAAQV